MSRITFTELEVGLNRRVQESGVWDFERKRLRQVKKAFPNQ